MRNAVRLLLLTLLFLAGAQELCASIPKTRVGKFFPLAASSCPENALQVPELRLDNPALYGGIVSGDTFWSSFDPVGLSQKYPWYQGGWVRSGLEAGVGWMEDGVANVGIGAVQTLAWAADQGHNLLNGNWRGFGTLNYNQGMVENLESYKNPWARRGYYEMEGIHRESLREARDIVAGILIGSKGGSSSASTEVSATKTIQAESSAAVSKEVSERMVTLEHGTTMERAQAIARGGPDAAFVEPGGLPNTHQGFSTVKPGVSLEKPINYAIGKAAEFKNEGGGAILRMEMPESVANFGTDLLGNEVRFNKAGTDALRWDWNKVKTTVTPIGKLKNADQ